MILTIEKVVPTDIEEEARYWSWLYRWIGVILYFHYVTEPIIARALIVLVIVIIVASVLVEHLTTTSKLCIRYLHSQWNTLSQYIKIFRLHLSLHTNTVTVSHWIYVLTEHIVTMTLFYFHSDILTQYNLSSFACLGYSLTKLHLFLIYQHRYTSLLPSPTLSYLIKE